MATKRLRITKCEPVYQGTGTKGPYTIYEIEAADANTGILVNQPLRSFDHLTVGETADFEVSKYERAGKPTTYTLKKAGGGGGRGNNALGPKVDELRDRLNLVEQNMEVMRANLTNVQQIVERLSAGQPAAQVTTPAPSLAGDDVFGGGGGSGPADDDDIPF